MRSMTYPVDKFAFKMEFLLNVCTFIGSYYTFLRFLGCMRYNSYISYSDINVSFVSKVFTIFSCVETPETGLFKNHALIHFQSLFISDFTIIIAKQNILLQD